MLDGTAEYVIDNVGTNTCSSGYTLIDSKQQCIATASLLGATFKGAGTYTTYPKGCFISQSLSTMYFNYDAVGAARSERGPVCIIPQPCNASVAPAHGGIGSCTSALAPGATCQPSCEAGYTVVGASSCSASGWLTTAAQCIYGGEQWVKMIRLQ